jgi:cytochrome P450
MPNLLQGLFTRNRFWVRFFSRFHSDPMGVRFVERLRTKYHSRYLLLSMVGTKTLLVLDPYGIQQVLERSPELYADPKSKRQGMDHFQPNALTISRSSDWVNRRRFNEAVLASGRLHPLAPAFLAVVRDEIGEYRKGNPDTFAWQHAEDLFRRITVRIIFGREALNDPELIPALDRLMRQSNRLFALRRNSSFDALYARIRAYLGAPAADSLVSLCKQAPADEHTRVENQLPHWMFAMKDTLAINTVYALALIVSRSEVAAQLGVELAKSQVHTAESIDQARYLEGCVQEAMRLWPTTPMLARAVIAPDLLGGEVVGPGMQVLIWNSVNHRDLNANPDADRFKPERWASRSSNYLYNHLSNGTQVCAGKDLALFLAKAILAELLSKDTFVLRYPTLPKDGPIPCAFDAFRAVFDRRQR